jgi:thiamine biosynthesis lipoprotein
MAAENEIQVHAQDAAQAEAAARTAIDEVKRVEAKYSRYRPESLLSRINASAGGEAVAIDEETAALFEFADACFRQSGGLFDITSGVLRRAWRFDEARVPSDEELAALVPFIGWNRVIVDAGGASPGCVPGVRLEAGMEIDFGGFGKEYAVDRAAACLKEAGVASAMVSLAGDLTILGPQPDGVAWNVGIQHPRRRDVLIARLPVFSGAIATSGDYERYVEVDGVRHCHVLDPRTGRSARGFRSVTVHAPSCLVAGSASTIAMLKGAKDGLAWLESLGLRHLCVLEDGAIVDRFA